MVVYPTIISNRFRIKCIYIHSSATKGTQQNRVFIQLSIEIYSVESLHSGDAVVVAAAAVVNEYFTELHFVVCGDLNATTSSEMQ